MSKNIFPIGMFTAAVTPFSADAQQVDYDSLSNLFEFQLKQGADGIVICGSTGEAATLSDEEYRQVVTFAMQQLKGRVPCVAGIGTNSTARACEMARALETIGVDALLLVAPPYNKPSQEGILAHFAEVKKVTRLPIVAYNVPGRTVANILPQTVAALAQRELIVGIKEASGSMDQVLDVLALVADCISVVSGEDSLVHAIMACGGRGVISASANIVPGIFKRITSTALAGQWRQSLEAQFKALPIVRAMFSETNPVPVKAALAMRGVIKSGAVRLPLLAAREETMQRIKSVLEI
jgi:4-hydroxy-tetrahydrodipicolinate synthase